MTGAISVSVSLLGVVMWGTLAGSMLPFLLRKVELDPASAEAWARIEAQWPGYRAYERESGRVVRLFTLRPVRDHADAGAPPPATRAP